MIRRIKSKDIDTLVKIEESLFNESFGRDFIFNALLKKNNAYYFVCTRHSQIVGYAGVMAVRPDIEIFGIGVKKEYQNMGCAQYLLNWLIKKARKKGYKKLFLDVRTKNENAIHVYEKIGFIRINRRKKFYVDDDSFTYMREI